MFLIIQVNVSIILFYFHNHMCIFRYPSELQLEACIREAEKIASLVNMQSPRIASELSLSSLTAASVVHTQVSASTSHHVNVISYLFPLVLLLLLTNRDFL